MDFSGGGRVFSRYGPDQLRNHCERCGLYFERFSEGVVRLRLFLDVSVRNLNLSLVDDMLSPFVQESHPYKPFARKPWLTGYCAHSSDEVEKLKFHVLCGLPMFRF